MNVAPRSAFWRLLAIFTMGLLTSLGTAACSDSSSDSDDASADDGSSDDAESGADSDGGPGSGEPDPCSLLTTTDLQNATGIGFGEGAFNDLSNDFQVICDWRASGSELATVQVLVTPGTDALENQRDSASDALGVVEVDVAGTEDAYQSEDGTIVGMDVGDSFLQVSYISFSTEDVSEATLDLAGIAASNIG